MTVVNTEGRYGGAEKRIISGNPNPKYITTSHIERQNLNAFLLSNI